MGRRAWGGVSPKQIISLVARVDAVFGDFDFGNPTEGEQQLYEILGRLFRGLFHNMGDSVGDRRLEHHALGMQASQVDAHELPWLQHQFPRRILPLSDTKCKPPSHRAMAKGAIGLADACPLLQDGI